MQTVDERCALPGEELVRQGLADLEDRRPSVPALLVQVANRRLNLAGLIPDTVLPVADAELQLYRRLREEGGDAYSRYNALLRELVSFEGALERRAPSQS